MNKILSFCGAVNLPRWHGFWSHHSFDSDISLSIDSHDDDSLGIKQIAESNSQPGTGWWLRHGANDSYTVTFSSGENSTNGVINRNLSSPPSSSESGQRCKPKPSTEDRLLNRTDFVPVQIDHSVILFSGRRGYEDEILARKEFHYDAQSSLSQASQMQSSDVFQQQQQHRHHHQSARPASVKHRKLFGLPDRITVSNREINMMSSLSF